jgi:Holliday junction resolvase-like predicted endonuclease
MLVYATAQRWGEIDAIYQQASEVLKVPVGTLQNWASVARNVEISRRRENLSLSHHIEVRGLSPEWQTYLLEQAEVRKLSKIQLRQVVALLNSGTSVDTLLDQVQAMKPKTDKLESLRQSQIGARAAVLAGFAKKKDRNKWLAYAQEQAAEWARLVDQLKGS